MIDNPTVNQVTQLGLETVEGTEVAATKRVLGLSFDGMDPQGNIETYRPAGYLWDTTAIQGKEWGQAKVKLLPCYNTLPYIFDSLLHKTTPTGGGTAKTRLWQPSSTVAQAMQTYTAEHGTAYQARRMNNTFINEGNFEFSRDGLKADAMAVGRIIQENDSSTATPIYLSTNQTYTLTLGGATAGTFTLTFQAQTTAAIAYNATAAAVEAALVLLSTIGNADNVDVTGTPGNYVITFTGALGQQALTMTGSGTGLTGGTFTLTSGTAGAAPTEVSTVAIAPGTVDVYLDTSAANLGTTQLNRGFKVNIKLGNRYIPVWALKSSASSFDGRVIGVPSSAVTLSLGCNSEATKHLANQRQGKMLFGRVVANGPAISGGGNNQLQWDFCFLINKPRSYEDASGVWAMKYDGVFAHDPTWGKALSITVIDALAAL